MSCASCRCHRPCWAGRDPAGRVSACAAAPAETPGCCRHRLEVGCCWLAPGAWGRLLWNRGLAGFAYRSCLQGRKEELPVRHSTGVSGSDVLRPRARAGQAARSAGEGQTAGNAVWHRQGAGTALSHTRLLSHRCYLLSGSLEGRLPQKTAERNVQQHTRLLVPPRRFVS